jgi:hypothetical protein
VRLEGCQGWIFRGQNVRTSYFEGRSRELLACGGWWWRWFLYLYKVEELCHLYGGCEGLGGSIDCI